MNWSGVFIAPFNVFLVGFKMNGLWMTSLFVCTFVLAIFFTIPRLCRQVQGMVLNASAVFMFLSIVFIVATELNLGSTELLFAIGGVSAGIGTGIITVYFGALITRYDPSIVLRFVAISLLGGALMCLLASWLPAPVVWASMAFAPFVELWSFRRAFQQDKKPSASYDGERGGVTRTSSTLKLAVFMLLVVVLGLSGGLLRGLMGVNGQLAQNAWLFGVASMIGAAMLLFSRVPEHGEPFALFYRAIAFVAAGFIILAFVTLHTSFAFVTHTIGFTYFYGLLWVFSVIYAQESPLPMHVFAGGFLANQIGQLAGAVAGNGLHALFDQGSLLLYASNLMIYLLLFATIVLLAKLSNDKSACKNQILTGSSMDSACVVASEKFELTKRETEILSYLIKGYDRAYIAQKLCVSPETVKTHTRHIYEKLNAHSRVELFNMVARCLEA